MLRQIVAAGTLLTLETLVVIHWFIYTDNSVLGFIALGAGSIMCLMALANVVLAIGIFRLDPSRPLDRKSLEDMAKAEPVWVLVTLSQFAFMGLAYIAGVYWLLAAMTIGHGAELAVFASARMRIGSPEPGLPA